MTPWHMVFMLQDNGFEAYFIGGCVRDMAMRKHPKDLDIVTSATPKDIIKIFRGSGQHIKLVGHQFGVVMVDNVEIATYRSDRYFGLNDKNCSVTYASTLQEDVARRDFTINQIAWNPRTGEVVDIFNGIEDINKKLIKFIGEPKQRIFEDPNRIIRACRFKALIGGEFEEETFKALEKYSDYIESHIKVERIRLEILKAMSSIKESSEFFKALYSIGGLKYILPSLDKCFGQEGGPYHAEDVNVHCLASGDHVNTKRPLIKLAGYLHDVGKPISARTNPMTQKVWFEGHEQTGRVAVQEDLTNLKFSRDEISFISNLVGLHMRVANERRSPKGIRRTLKALAEANLKWQDLVRVAISDKMGGTMAKQNYRIGDIKKLAKAFRAEIKRKPVSKFSDLAIDGFEIMKLTGLKPGKEVGKILEFLMEQTLENPELNNIEDLSKLSMEYKV